MEPKSVGYCADLVRDVESLEGGAWRRFQGHPKYVSFADEYLTAKCVTDFWWFLSFGVYHNAMKHYDPVLHQDVCRWLCRWSRVQHGMEIPVRVKWLIMARELCKTQILIAHDVWSWVQDRNQRLLVRGYIDTKAAEISSALMEIIESPRFQRRFGWVRPETRGGSNQYVLWRPDKFRLERDEIGVRVPSMEAYGVDGEPTGGHFHMSHYDDYEVDTNANSDVLRAKMFNTWKNDNNLHMAGSRRKCAGTPWSRQAIVHGVLYRCNGLDQHDYDVYRMPCWLPRLDRPFDGMEPVLEGDRRTLRDWGAGFPTVEANLETMQARVLFFSPEIGDTVEEVREIVWNDGNRFRCNRPFPAILGQPLRYHIPVLAPACPIRQTMDSIDWTPEQGENELPPVVSQHRTYPGVIELNNRNSLPQKRHEEGPIIFAAQNELNAVDESSLILNPDDLVIIDEAEIPAGERKYYRAVDFATAKSTAASTSITTAFYHASGLYIVHIAYHEKMTSNAKILELLLGARRVEESGHRLLRTSFEKTGMIEDTLGEFWRLACRDPHKYFNDLGDKQPYGGGPSYAHYAQQWFTPGQRVSVPEHWIPRKSSKIDRIKGVGPEWEAGRVHIVRTCPHLDTLYEQARSCTHDAKGSFDLLDNVADLVAEFAPPRHVAPVKAKAVEDMFGKYNRKAAELAVLQGIGVNPGWR